MREIRLESSTEKEWPSLDPGLTQGRPSVNDSQYHCLPKKLVKRANGSSLWLSNSLAWEQIRNSRYRPGLPEHGVGGKKLQSKESGQAAPHYPLPLLPGLCMLESPGLTQRTSTGHQRSAHLKLRAHSLVCAYFLPPFLILSVCISPRQIEDPTGSPPWDVPQDCKQECRI